MEPSTIPPSGTHLPSAIPALAQRDDQFPIMKFIAWVNKRVRLLPLRSLDELWHTKSD